jgi:hypothetical protein
VRLDAILDAGQLPDLADIRAEFKASPPKIIDVAIPPPDLAGYDGLLVTGDQP